VGLGRKLLLLERAEAISTWFYQNWAKNVRKAVKLLEDSLAVLKKRNKLIRIADKSKGGWTAVDEYLSDEVASDSEDQKRIGAAENRGVKKIKTSKKDDKQRGKRRPAEAAGAITQTTHNDGSSISSRSYQIQPFRAAGGLRFVLTCSSS
jgi:hypothetical protein